MLIEPIHATSLITLVANGDQINQNEYGLPRTLDLAAAAGLPEGTALSGEVLRIVLVSRAAASKPIAKPAGTVYLFTAKPVSAVGDSALESGWEDVWAAATVTADTWKGDTAGAMATILETPVPFEALTALYAVWVHADTTAINGEEADDQTIHMRAWFRRLS